MVSQRGGSAERASFGPVTRATARVLRPLAVAQDITMVMSMVTVSKSALKARMFEYFRQVEETGEPLVVTHHGRPVLQVVPYAQKRPMADVLAEFRAIGPVRFVGDPNPPTVDEWDVA
jgi:prevent-host-death family protein